MHVNMEGDATYKHILYLMITKITKVKGKWKIEKRIITFKVPVEKV